MNMILEHSFLLLIVLGLYSAGVECLRCYSCTSLTNRDCAGPDLSAVFSPVECRPGYDYCIKYTGYLKNSDHLVVRKCDNTPKDSCVQRKIRGQEVKVCYTYCNTDHCNGDAVITNATMMVSVASSACNQFSVTLPFVIIFAMFLSE